MNRNVVFESVSEAAVPLASLALLPLLHIGLRPSQLLLAFSVVLLFVIAGRIHASKARGRRELSVMCDLFETSEARMRNGKPLAASIEYALNAAPKGTVAGAVLTTTTSRMRAGETFGDALAFAAMENRRLCADETWRALAALASSFKAEGNSAINRFTDDYRRTHADEQERRIGSLQRSATISMVTGTVVPSFMTFGLVGYSITYSQGFATGTFAVALLVGMAGIYRISNWWMDDA